VNDRDESVVHLEGVEVRIEGRTILTGIDWTIRPGERWVVLGPNGSGKTTLLRVVGLALHPSRGSVRVLGATLGQVDVRRHRHLIGVVSAAVANSLRPTIAAVDVVMTARHGALEPWWHSYTTDDRDRAQHLLDRFGIGFLADHEFGTLSSGERQRTLLARSLMADPSLVILDEPAAGLDLEGRESLLSDLTALAADPAIPATILVTHHPEEIPPEFTHLLLLRDGEIHAAGPIEATLTQQALSTCFGLDLELQRQGGRWWARSSGSKVSPPL
jgi:iron complex transport system ATP-binding protein